MAELCKHFALDFFMINDWDMDEEHFTTLSEILTEDQLRESDTYLFRDAIPRNPTEKATLTTNWKLINKSITNQIHFNLPKLEAVLGYNSDDKNSLGIWNRLNEMQGFEENFFPQNLKTFLEFGDIQLPENNNVA